MFVRLFGEKNNPKSLMVINVDTIRHMAPIQVDGGPQKCALWFAKNHSVTVDHEFDYVVSLLEEATGSQINPMPPARPTPPSLLVLPPKEDMPPSKSKRPKRI
jgi:hypothetical protein